MKNFYNEPKMDISLFSEDDIVTVSGTQTAEQLADTALNNFSLNSGQQLQKVKFTW